MSYDTGSAEETEAGKQQWIRDTLEIRRTALSDLNRCSHPSVDNFQAVRVPEAVRNLHSSTLSYAEQIRPKSRKLTEVDWDTDISEKRIGRKIYVPKDNTIEVEQNGEVFNYRVGYEVGTVDRYGNAKVEDVLEIAERQPREVNPATLGQKWRAGNQVALTARVEDGSETIREHKTFAVYLPPAACSALISHLDDCLDDLDWLPGGVKTVEGTVTPDGEIEYETR